MKTGIVVLLVGLVSWMTPVLADCDLSQFRWGCDRAARTTPKPYVSSLVYCRNTPLYVTKESYDLLLDYQRANVSMNVILNGEFVEGPCLPGHR